ncbi:MAG: nitrogen regulation protein NR(II) [Pseudomonadota bacterium]
MSDADTFRHHSGQILDALVTGVLVLDEQLKIRHINAAAESMLQTSASHACDQSVDELIVRADKLLPSLRHAMELNQPFTERAASLRLPDNLQLEVDFMVSILELEQRYLVLELQPRDRLNRIDKDGRSIDRQETTQRLIRGLAHEVKNPLGGIRGAAQLLEHELPEPELREYTSVIINEADRLKELVDRMLGPQRRLEIGPLNILKVSEHVIRLLQAETAFSVTWIRDYDPSLPEIEGDEAQLIQALLNVMRNACQALQDHDDPKVTIASRVVRQFTLGSVRHKLVLRLDISDNGPGIDPELEDRIFFPMISGRAEGSGLGLAITQNIISQHGGSIQVTSRPGATTFTTYIPFTQVPPAKETAL